MFLFRSLPSIVGGLRGPTMYRARNLYLVHTVDSFSLPARETIPSGVLLYKYSLEAGIIRFTQTV